MATHGRLALSGQLLIRIVSWSIILVGAVTVLAFVQVYEHEKNHQLETVTLAATNKVAAAAKVFEDAEQTTQAFADVYLAAYQRRDHQELLKRYADWVETTPEGIERTRRKYFEGVQEQDTWWQHISGFIGPWPASRDDEFRVRVALTLELLNQLGPAWQHDFANTHVTLPENTLINYWPNNPWGLLARADLDMTAYSTVQATLQEYNPQRTPVWTGLYYDESAGHWVITYQRPVDFEGRHLITPSHDIYLDEVMASLEITGVEGAEAIVFNQQNELVAGPQWLTENREYVGTLKLATLADERLNNLYRVIENEPPTAAQPTKIYMDAFPDSTTLAVWVPGPEWWYITLYPKQLVQGAALQVAAWVALFAIIGLVSVLLMTWWFIKRRVSKPIQSLSDLAVELSHGNYRAAINFNSIQARTGNEIDLLNVTMREMAIEISAQQGRLSEQVKKRTAELEQLNQKLALMAHVDGLTGLMNRRALDRDLLALCRAGDAPQTALIILDVDYFKRYNDTYGHEAGDIALQRISGQLMDLVRGRRVYRYGGEELVALYHVRDAEHAAQLAERYRERIRAMMIPHHDSPQEVITVSIGGTMMSAEDSPAAVLRRADELLYEAKLSGRDRVCFASE